MSNKRIVNGRIDHKSKTIVPLNLEEFNHIIQFFEDGSQVTLTIEPYVRPVELSQMRLLHAYINEIHKETEQDRETIKQYLKENYGARNEDNSLKSSANYTTTEMNRMISGTVLFMQETLGMTVADPETFKKHNIK